MPKRERKPVPLVPLDWSQELWDKVLERIREGAPPSRAATAEGIPSFQWAAWTNPDLTPMSREKARQVLQAEAHAECEMVKSVRLGDTTWRSNAWLLERRWPERWSEHRDKQGTEGPLQVVVKLASDDAEDES